MTKLSERPAPAPGARNARCKRPTSAELKKLAAMTIEPVQIPAIDWNDPQMRQRLWMLQVSQSMVTDTKAELRDRLNGLAPEGVLHELGDALTDASAFFAEAKKLCDAALGRIVIAAAANAQA